MEKENKFSSKVGSTAAKSPPKKDHYIYVTPEKRTKPVNYPPEKKKVHSLSD